MGKQSHQNGVRNNEWNYNITEKGHKNGHLNSEVISNGKVDENGRKKPTFCGEVAGSEIQEFYKGKNVFITGVTGFIGKVLLERYLASCSSLDTIYVMIRGKSGHTPSSRLDKLLDCPLFQHIDKKVLSKVYPVVGELGSSTMGLSTEDYDMLMDKVDVVVHCAANVKFDATLHELVKDNIKGTLDLLELCKKMKRLISFVYVSTIYSNYNDTLIDEKVYEPGLDVDVTLGLEKVNAEDSDILQIIMPKIMKTWPNLYSFTKCITENLVMERGKELPACIIRPGLVLPTSYLHSVPGYIDNFNGAILPLVGASMGYIRITNFRKYNPTTMQPADYCANAIIASSWATACKRFNSDLTIYNFVPLNKLSWCLEPFAMRAIEHSRLEPSDQVYSYPFVTLIENEALFYLLAFFIYLIPGMCGDIFRVITRKKPKYLKSFRRLLKHNELTGYLIGLKYTFGSRNNRKLQKSLNSVDRCLFKMDLDDFPLASNMRVFMRGIKQYLLKESPETSKETLKKLEKYKIRFYTSFYLIAIIATCVFIFISQLIFTQSVNFILNRIL